MEESARQFAQIDLFNRAQSVQSGEEDRITQLFEARRKNLRKLPLREIER
jgi:hypothetical protein